MIFTVLSRASNPLRSGVRGAWCHFSALQRASCSSDVERTRGDLNTTPLCERPARAVLNAAELLAARQACRKENKYYADTCTDEDAPSEEELNRELDWLLDDAFHSFGAECQVGNKLADKVAASDSRQWRCLLADNPAELSAEERQPLQYVCHVAHWRDMLLAVGPGVLIPRPETEAIVDIVMDILQSKPYAAQDTTPRLLQAPWLDLGTGSGALACALARWRVPQLCSTKKASLLNAPGIAQTNSQSKESVPQVYAVDSSSHALAYARANVARLEVQDAVTVCEGSWCDFEGASKLVARCGVLVSNPPYIPSHKVAGLQPEVSRHEPWLALDGGEGNGINAIQRVVECGAKMLGCGGVLVLETEAADQVDLVEKLVTEHQQQSPQGMKSFTSVKVWPDCFGKRRFVSAIRC